MILVQNTEKELKKRINQGKKIICFGASSKAINAVTKITLLKDEILFFWDNDERKDNTSIEIDGVNYPVYLFSESKLEELEYQKIIIVISSSFYREILLQLNNISQFDKVEVFTIPFSPGDYLISGSEKFYNNRITEVCEQRYKSVIAHQKKSPDYFESKMKQVGKAFIIPNVGILLTTRCTLNCQQCLGLIPYFKKQQDTPIESFLNNLKIIMSSVDECVHMGISGGEVFLHKDLDKALLACIMEDKIQEVVLSTNGTIMPNTHIIELLKNEKVIVNISNYGNVVDASIIRNLFIKEKITYVFNEEQIWSILGDNNKRNKSVEQLKHEYLRCVTGKSCKTVVDGKLFVCYRAAMQYMAQGFTDEKNYVSLLEYDEVGERRKKIEELFLKEYAEICNYCDMSIDYPELTEPGVQAVKLR